jgi:hypothetical protein
LAPARVAQGDPLGDLEVLRCGFGVLPPADDPDPGLAVETVPPRGSKERPLRSCTCRESRQRTCTHLLFLGERLRAAETRWGGLDWEASFARTLWGRLAPHLFTGERGRRLEVEVRRLAGGELEIVGKGGEARIQILDGSPVGLRLADRLTRVGDGLGRSALLDRLALLQATPEEQLFLRAGMPSQRQALESSLARRLAYHVVREHGDPGGSFHPAVETATGELRVTFRTPDGVDRYRFTLPRQEVRAVLGLLAARFPKQEDLQLRPIPLRSLFLVSEATEVDLELRPVIQALQAKGEARYLAEEELARYRYGNLVYLPELGVMGELEKAERPRRFTAPKRLRLERSRLPQVAEELAAAMAAGELVLDRGVTLPRIVREPSSLAIEVGEEKDEERGWYWLSASYGEGRETVPLSELVQAAREGRRYAATRGGDWLDLEAPGLRVLAVLAARPAAELEGRDGRLRLSAVEVLRLAAGAGAPAQVSGQASAARRLEALLELRPPAPFQSPAGLRSPLHPYQLRGAEWLAALWHYGLGGLLCDDMGLGKTHQAMALLLHLYEGDETDLPSLVVAPLTVLDHWRKKLAEHAPGLLVVTFHGPQRDLEELTGPGVVLTSYGTMRAAAEELVSLPWALAIFDEAQQLKNAQTQGYRVARSLDAEVKIGLSGTPVENHPDELRALLALVAPAALAGLGGDGRRGAAEGEERGGARGAEASPSTEREALRRGARPFVLRRVKGEVLTELPERIDDLRTCRLSDEQVGLYRQVVGERAGPLLEQLSRGGETIPYLHVFAVLNLLKRICDHPALALACPEAWREHASGKWDLFCELLDEALGSGQKVVVFSQYLEMLRIMAEHLEALGVGHVTLTGASRGRGALVDRFNGDEECRVFLGSLKAGGTGIDLVGGSVVVHYDRWWNAAREDQATDRVHRMGQRRSVHVLRLVTEGTLEERIDAMIERKRALLDEVVAVDSPELSKVFTREELVGLLAPAGD